MGDGCDACFSHPSWSVDAFLSQNVSLENSTPTTEINSSLFGSVIFAFFCVKTLFSSSKNTSKHISRVKKKPQCVWFKAFHSFRMSPWRIKSLDPTLHPSALSAPLLSAAVAVHAVMNTTRSRGVWSRKWSKNEHFGKRCVTGTYTWVRRVFIPSHVIPRSYMSQFHYAARAPGLRSDMALLRSNFLFSVHVWHFFLFSFS